MFGNDYVLRLGKPARALSTPGEQALVVGQVVEILSYCKVSFIVNLLHWPCRKEGSGREEVGSLLQKHNHWLISQLSEQICLYKDFPGLSVFFKKVGVSRIYNYFT